MDAELVELQRELEEHQIVGEECWFRNSRTETSSPFTCFTLSPAETTSRLPQDQLRSRPYSEVRPRLTLPTLLASICTMSRLNPILPSPITLPLWGDHFRLPSCWTSMDPCCVCFCSKTIC